MKVYFLDKPGFLKQVYKSKGNVYLHLPDGSVCNLKQDALACQLFLAMDIPAAGLTFTFSDPVDTANFLSFLIGMKKDQQCA